MAALIFCLWKKQQRQSKRRRQATPSVQEFVTYKWSDGTGPVGARHLTAGRRQLDEIKQSSVQDTSREILQMQAGCLALEHILQLIQNTSGVLLKSWNLEGNWKKELSQLTLCTMWCWKVWLFSP